MNLPSSHLVARPALGCPRLIENTLLPPPRSLFVQKGLWWVLLIIASEFVAIHAVIEGGAALS